MGRSAILLWTGSHMVSNVGAILCWRWAAGFNFLLRSSWWATCIDLTPTIPDPLRFDEYFSGAWLAADRHSIYCDAFWMDAALDFAAMLTAIGAIYGDRGSSDT